MMKKILCPTDLSDAAMDGTVFAAKLTKKLNGELTLFNVQALMERTPEEAIFGEKINVEEISKSIETRCKEISKVFKISCHGEVESAWLSTTNLIAEKAIHFDLVVMGTNGADDLYQFFTGSNSYKVIRKTNTPVLLIPNGFLYTDIQKTVFAYDYLHHKQLPLIQLMDFLSHLKSSLTVLEVLDEANPDKDELELMKFQENLKKFNPNDPIKFNTILGSDVPNSIHQYALRNEIDLLALCTENRNFLAKLFHTSVTKFISAIARYPIFVFHH